MIDDGVPDKSRWTPPQWQAYVASQPTREQRNAALDEVPEAWRSRVRMHVETVFSVRKFYARRRSGERGVEWSDDNFRLIGVDGRVK